MSKTWKELKIKLEEKIRELYKEIDRLLGKSNDLNRACNNLQTIPGIGKTTAITLLAEIPNVNALKNTR